MSDTININVYETTEEVTINVTPNVIEVNINKITGGGGGTQTLAQTLDLGNQTGGENILVNNADAIELENTSSLQKGTYNFGGNGGISRICSNNYEDMWQNGFRHVFDQSGFIRNSTNCFNIVPDASFDVTLRFKVGSIWTQDNGTSYICTNATEGSAVWEIYNSISNLVPYTGANDDVNIGTNDLYTNKVFLYDEPNDNYGSIHYTDGDFHIEDADGHKLLVIEDGFMQLHLSDTIQSNLYTTDLTETRNHYLPNNSGTIALTSDIPTTPDEVGALAIDGSNANSDVDLGNNNVLSKTFFVGETNKMNILADLLTDNRYARFQDKDYDGIADITDIPDISNLVVKNTAITGATKTKITYDSKGLVTSGADATTADIADSTNKRYQTDNQRTFNDATSSIQTQLNGKQATLSYTPYKFVQNSQTAHTGTTSETIVATATINGSTFNSSDIMKMLFGLNKGTTSSGASIRIKINTSNTLTGATQIAIFNVTGTASVTIFKRNFMLNGGNLYGLNFANTAVVNDEVNNATTYGSTAYNTSNTLYLFFTIQLITSGDSMTPNLCNLTN